MATTPWAKFSLPGSEAAYARGESLEFRKTLRQIFGPLVEPVTRWPEGRHPWLLAEVPADGSLSAFFRELEKNATSVLIVQPGLAVLDNTLVLITSAGVVSGPTQTQ